MTLQDIQDQALELSTEERWQLIDALMHSLQHQECSTAKPRRIAASLIGIAKTEASPPTDEEVKAALDERRLQKYS